MTKCELPDKEPRFKRFKHNKTIMGVCVIIILLFLVGMLYVNKAVIVQAQQMDNIHDAQFLRENGYHVSGLQKTLQLIHALITLTLGVVLVGVLGSRNYYYKRQRFLESIIERLGNNGIFEEKKRLELQHEQQLQRKRGVNAIIGKQHKLI